MKRFSLILLTLILTATVAMAQDKKAPKAEFKNIEHNFGKVDEAIGSVSTEFKFMNTGNAPMIIQRVQTTCGCTTPDYSKKPILPGEQSSIQVSYSTVARPGVFDKKITIFSNVPNEVYILTIKGEVTRKR